MKIALIALMLIVVTLSGCSYRGIPNSTLEEKNITPTMPEVEETSHIETRTPEMDKTDVNKTESATTQKWISSEEKVEESSWPPEKTTTPYVITYSPSSTSSWPPEKKSSSTGMLFEYGVKYEVRVDDVIDGDTFLAVMPDGSKEYIRFLGIDAPETTPTDNAAEEFGNISNLDCIAEWGEKAIQFTTSMLENRNVSIKFDPLAGMTDYSGKFIAYVYLQDDDFAEILIEQGYARVYTEAEYEKKSEYLEYQKKAIVNSTGLWGCEETQETVKEQTKSPIIILEVHYDADGDDNMNLNDEYIVLKNTGENEVNLQGWFIEDVSMNKFYFPDILIQPGSTITLHTGVGINMPDRLYWGSSTEIWDNHHDTVYLYNVSRYLVDYYTW